MPVQEWNLEGVLEELSTIDFSMKDRSFAFILGAGASFKSNIPTGKDLAQRWLRDLHKRECLDSTELDEWLSKNALEIPGLNYANAAEFYPQLFERRFRGDREAGYAELEAAMEGKVPSLGYSLLAEIIQTTRHKVVVTTNFDNLVADALAMHAHQSPLIVAHESLVGFVRPQLRRPLVAKIHRDLFFAPKNDQAGVDTMEEGWQNALRKLFQHYTPIVVGYGGNDGSLMGLLKSLAKGEIAGRMIWCYREGAPPSSAVREVLSLHEGIEVKIAGFDEFMLQLASKLVPNFDLAAIAERTQKLGQERAERYRQQANELRESSAKGNAAQKQAGKLISKSVRSGKSWFAWQMRADNEPDLQKRLPIYEDGLRHFPQSSELHGNYAVFLSEQLKNYDAAEAMYKKALELDPSNANTARNYAIFLEVKRNNHNAAEVMYKNALELDPNNAATIADYANFLADRRKEYDAAEVMYKKALELDPSNANIIGSYANFLADQRNSYDAAEVMYKKALELNPTDAYSIGNYANFLEEQRKDYDAAEAMYKRALETDPNNANATANYAVFLEMQRKDYDAAETMYKKAIELDPVDANVASNYADFLDEQRKDYAASESMYKKAIELDPRNTNAIGKYATFLEMRRKDYGAAESMYKKAIELDPSDINLYANFSSLLLTRGETKDYENVSKIIEQGLSIDIQDPQPRAELLFYQCLHAELTNKDANSSMSKLKNILERGYPRAKWNFNLLLSAVLPKISPKRTAIYRLLGDAILDARFVKKLDELKEWQLLK